MKLGVIGCGKMATALVGGAISARAVSAENVVGYNRSPNDAFTKATSVTVTQDPAHLNDCDVLLLGTKPQQAAAALAKLAETTKDALVISIAAGLSTTWLSARLPTNFRVVRCMPNTPSLIGEGAAGYALGANASPADGEITRSLLSAVGLAIEVPESTLDGVTGVSGSGPAYVFLMIEALADGGVKNGIPRADAIKLAAQTVAGAAKMVLETGKHPAELRDQVTSPGGTTIAGIAMLERGGVRAALINAVDASAARSIELGCD